MPTPMIDRLEEIAVRFHKNLPAAKNRFEENTDSGVLWDHRFLSVADYIKTKKAGDFRAHLRKIVRYIIIMYQREEWVILDNSPYLGNASIEYILAALASGDWVLTNQLMAYTKQIIFPGEILIWHSLFRACILNELSKLSQLQDWIDLCQGKAYLGYPLAFKAILEGNVKALEDAFKIMMKGHKYLCQKNIGFGESIIDKFISIPSVAMLNLGRFKGLFFDSTSSYVPNDLLVTPEEVQASLKAWDKEKATFKITLPLPRRLEDEKLYFLFKKLKVPNDLMEDLFSLHHDWDPRESQRARAHFVGTFNDDREYKKFKKFVPFLPRYLIQRLIDLMLSKSTYHQKQCDELRQLMMKSGILTLEDIETTLKSDQHLILQKATIAHLHDAHLNEICDDSLPKIQDTHLKNINHWSVNSHKIRLPKTKIFKS